LIRPDKPEAILNTHVPYSSLLGGGIECRRRKKPVTLKERLDGSEGVELTSGALKHTKSFWASARQISQLAKAGFFVPYFLGSAKYSPVYKHLDNRASTRLKPLLHLRRPISQGVFRSSYVCEFRIFG
jgi:hypothetical protein